MKNLTKVRLPFSTIIQILRSAREQNITLGAVLVFSQASFKQEYSLESRSYKIYNTGNYFDNSKISKSLWANNLDGTDRMVRLDYYLHDWNCEYGYLIPSTEQETE